MIKEYIIYGMLALISGCLGGYLNTEFKQTCPECKQCTLERAETTNASKASYCSDIIAVQECEPVIKYVTLDYIPCVKCNCDTEYAEGRDDGYVECTSDHKRYN